MKINTVRYLSVFFASLVLINCGGGNKAAKPTPVVSDADASLRTPTKEILVTDGDINKKYTILGQVDYTPKEGSSVYSDQIEAKKHAKELLKKVAFTKYGDKVDAIINTKTLDSLKGGFWGAVGAGYGARSVATSVEGIAVSFDEPQSEATVTEEPVTKPTVKSKRKTRKSK